MNELEKEFVPYEPGLALKELGFDEPCFGYYNDNNEFEFFADVKNCNTNTEFEFYPTAPTFSQAFRWFREKYFIHHKIGRDYDTWDYELYDFKSGNKHIPTGFKTFETYEKTELECLKKLIEIVKNASPTN